MKTDHSLYRHWSTKIMRENTTQVISRQTHWDSPILVNWVFSGVEGVSSPSSSQRYEPCGCWCSPKSKWTHSLKIRLKHRCWWINIGCMSKVSYWIVFESIKNSQCIMMDHTSASVRIVRSLQLSWPTQTDTDWHWIWGHEMCLKEARNLKHQAS